MQHEFTARTWSKVGVDLCYENGRNLLVMCYYYSNFIDVAHLKSTPTRSVIQEMKEVFARFGVPDVVVTNKAQQFASAEFAVFATMSAFEHVTSSPQYPQSNRKAVNAVKTIKRLCLKCRDSGESEFKALLDWRNTSNAGVGTSPAQRLMGRRCKTLLPVAGALLMPRHDIETDTCGLLGIKRRQQHYANQSAEPHKPIKKGDAIRMMLIC